MNALPPKHLVVRHTRMLLIKAGLREDEADKLLGRISSELSSGALLHQKARLTFVERELAQLKESQPPKTLGVVNTIILSLICGTVSGVAANYITKAIDGEIGRREPEVLPPQQATPQQDLADIIQIDWAGVHLPGDVAMVEPTFRSALHIHEQQNGTLNCRTAIYLDAMGYVLDTQGKHAQAEGMRRQALKISQRVNGPDHESTGAALSNLGLCLFAQRKFAESDQFLAKGLMVLIGRLGTNHFSTIGAIYNFYFCLHAQGRLSHVATPQLFLDALPEFQKMAVGRMALKVLLISLLALLDVVNDLQTLLRPQ